MRYFYVMEISDLKLRCMINAMRVLADPETTEDAHVTLRGPYKQKIEMSKFNEILIGKTVSVFGAGKFFRGDQATVYLRCGFKDLDKVWNKPDYQGRNCHITIYDGEDIEFARLLFENLKEHKLFFWFEGSELIEQPDEVGQRELVGLWNRDLACVE